VAKGNTKELSQIILDPGLAGEQFNFSFWLKTREVSGEEVKACLGFNHTEGGTNEVFCSPGTFGSSGWTQFVVFGATASKNFDNYYITLDVSAASGKAWFDKVQLVPAP
jgi:hypothetical protein